MKKLFMSIGFAALMLMAGANVYLANQTNKSKTDLNLDNLEAFGQQLPEWDPSKYDPADWSLWDTFKYNMGWLPFHWYHANQKYDSCSHTCTHFEVCDQYEYSDGCEPYTSRTWSITVG